MSRTPSVRTFVTGAGFPASRLTAWKAGVAFLVTLAGEKFDQWTVIDPSSSA